MKFGQALKEVREDAGHNQDVPAQVANVTRDAISKYETGRRRVPNDVMRKTAQHFDEPRLYVSAANDVTGGAWFPWLDNVDLHRSTVHLKTVEEIGEMIEVMQRIPITKTQVQMSSSDLVTVKKTVEEGMEAVTSIVHYIAVLCQEYDLSWRDEWQRHKQSLKAKRYIRE